MLKMTDRVQAAEQRIRDIVNSPRRHQALMQSRQRWFQLCAAMDAIGDTQLAVRAYLDQMERDDESKGWSYIVVYGVLQVLYVQQDAAKTLASCLNLKLDLPDELEGIRGSRNDAVGHPTGRGAFISRITLSTSGFQLLANGRGRRAAFRWISVRAAAEKQTEVMGSFLERAVEHLVADELVHRQKFRRRPLRALLPRELGYMLEKIAEGLREPSSKPLALGGIDSIRAAVATLDAAIDERGLTEAFKDSVGEAETDVKFALDRIESRLQGGLADWTDRDADIYWFFLSGKLNELEDLAAEIDDRYASDEDV